MRIGVIGIGKVGGALAARLVQIGNQVQVANARGADAAKAFADQIEATATDVLGAVQDVDLVILSVPFGAIPKLPKHLFSRLPDHVPLIDTSNYSPGVRDVVVQPIEDGMVESVWVSEQLSRSVIKAFNNTYPYAITNLGKRKGAPDRRAVAFAGDAPAQKRSVGDLIEELGFDPLDAGRLDESWRLQRGGPIYGCDYDASTIRDRLSTLQKDEVRRRASDFLTNLKTLMPANPDYERMVEVMRQIATTP